MDKFFEYWKVLAQKFKDNKWVIGYDIINEPYPGMIQKDISYMIDTKKFDR